MAKRIPKSVLFFQRPPAGAVAIPLGHGRTAWVDDQDAEALLDIAWHGFLSDGLRVYARGRERRTRRVLLMHRVVVERASGPIPDKKEVDHIVHRADIGVVDNRRSNLRIATGTQNQANRRKGQIRAGKPCASRYKGVTLSKRGRWLVFVGRKYRGAYESEIDAARAYDKAALAEFGLYAAPNLPSEEAGV